MNLSVQIIGILLCILGAAFYSGIETGVVSIRRLRLRHMVKIGDKKARILIDFLEKPERLLGTTLIGTNLCVIVASVLSAHLAAQRWDTWGQVATSVTMSILLLIFSEYLPKAWFRAHPFNRSRQFALLLAGSWNALRPFALAVNWFASLIIPGKVSSREDLCALASRAELKLLATEGHQHGILTPEEHAMVSRVIELSDRTARQIMIPRCDFRIIDSEATVADFCRLARDVGFTRFPVYSTSRERFIGTANVFDILPDSSRTANRPIREFVRPPVLIPETLHADAIFPRLRLARQPMGLVINERNEVIGMVTAQDILSRIVGVA